MTPKDALTIIAEIKKLSPRLNDWEKGFLGNFNHCSISKKQETALLNIYKKAAGGGIYQSRQYV